MSEKFVIAVVGKPSVGKSSALLELTARFPFIKSEPIFKHNHDLAVVGEYVSENSNQLKKLGICTIGDDIQFLEEGYLPLLIKDKCDIVIVASRNKRDLASNTFNYVADRAKENGYKFLTNSIIHDEKEYNNDGSCVDSVNEALLNQVFAENMINLINRLSQ